MKRLLKWLGIAFLLALLWPEFQRYAAEHRLMWDLWDLAGGNGNPDAFRRFSEPAVRRAMIPVIEEARESDRQAAAHIERALERHSARRA